MSSLAMPKSLSVFLLSVLAFGSAVAADENQPDPERQSVSEWLDRMALAVETLDYRGTLVQIRDGEMNAFEVIRRVDDQGIQERVYALNGPAQELVRDDDQYQSTLSGSPRDWYRADLQDRLMAHQPLNQLADLASAYELRLSGIDRVAGLEAQRIDIWPKDRFRYAQRLWLEKQTGMWLRSMVLDAEGRVLQEQGFVQLELGATVTDSDLAPQTKVVDTAPAQTAQQMEPPPESGPDVVAAPAQVSGMLRPLWAPQQLPQHFRLINASHGRSDVDTAFDHLLFSDGLTSFSVYIDHAPQHAVQTRLSAVGPVHILSGMMGQRQFTIMGQVPAQTVEFVGRQFLSAPKTDDRP